MRKAFVFVLSIVILSVLHFSFPKAYAEITVRQDPESVCQDSDTYTLIFTSDKNDFDENENYTLGIWKPGANPNNLQEANITWGKPEKQIYLETIPIVGERATLGEWHYKLWLGKGTNVLKKEPNRLVASGKYLMFPKEACTLGLPILEMSSPVQIGSTQDIVVRNINPDSDYILWFLDGQVFNNGQFPFDSIEEKGTIKIARLKIRLDTNPGSKTLCLKHGKTNFLGFGKDNCEISIPIEVTVTTPQVTPVIIQSGKPGASLEKSTLFLEPTPISPLPPCTKWVYFYADPEGRCKNKDSISKLDPKDPKNNCRLNDDVISTDNPQYVDPDFKDRKCIAINTAIGEISTQPQGFVRRIFSFVLGIAGGIALILIILSGYKMMASQGNPEALTAARDQLISAIVGLVFIILSFVILQVIGVDILKIPGFSK